jgi:hypothetical protein
MVNAPLNAETLGRLQAALEYWQHLDYEFVNLPWLVSRSVLEYTRPPQANGDDIYTPHGGFVASGEQSFIQLWVEGLLQADRRYIGWTPCLRQEAVFDARHHFYFLKAELFAPCSTSDALQVRNEMVTKAIRYFRSEAGEASVRVVDNTQLDIEVAGIEVGSYGIRKLPAGESYVYGTALAEPRLSHAIDTRKAKDAVALFARYLP